MNFEELVFLIGLLGQLLLNAVWLYRILDYKELVEDKFGWKKGLMFFMGSVFSFGFSTIGFLTSLTFTVSFLFWMSGFLASVSAFFGVVEALAYFDHVNRETAAYIPK